MKLVRLVLGLLPASRLKNRLLSRTSARWSIDPTARLGPVVILNVESMTVGPGAQVGLLNMFRDMHEVSIGTNVVVGSFNWFTGTSAVIDPTLPTAATFRLGDESVLLSRHYLDCGGGILIGTFTGIAGIRSTLLSHSINPMVWGNDLAPIVIGERCLLGTNSLVLPGVTVADRVMVAAGATVVRDLTDSEQLYAGAPAKPVRDIAGAALFTVESLTLVPEGAPARRRRR